MIRSLLCAGLLVTLGASAAPAPIPLAIFDFELGAEQSLVGVVSRISRTEYVVKFHIRDARTGNVIATGDSGLRMGAHYSWSRGAASLFKDQLIRM